MTNLERFAEAYRRNLRKAVGEQPEQYSYGLERVDEVADKMVAAYQRKSANKDSPASRWTCKELGIKHTYTEIYKFIGADKKPD